ncbi:hypothetical protein COCCADRAFT_8666 [Bipolaris zeicola 26-R-13]|uniref:Mitochondrial division protein 1 n=1 Tax=Cochliobolus carbonum (strain 26-R-13) TaxID=930089 RepID=W6XV39_COCC2|nr:uncharacterized protein COCCADRAFT_8666 [Bipolaris zeicola 26-R-13]EUC29070.1 hypothetical protein COCCADRAFT_8666 [Bipolaris zeicola 26-R-13]
MRLLEYGEDGNLTITSFDDDAIPPYAILSHTWGADTEEVTFSDITKADSKHKLGYEKIRFCGDQARKDKLQYFWVDTCCIDKTDLNELSTAIRSMFRWYQNATKCYVYLPDVLANEQRSDEMFAQPWEPAFRSSRWFTRGWTLQELLAPSKVEFFTREGEMLGDKTSLTPLISKITGIPPQVLQGTLAQFDIEERLRWRGHRQTKLEEDMAYSLSGICDVDIAPIYGEGEKAAFGRLHDKIRKLKDCVRDLRSSDPYDDKKRIEDTKGGLLADSYRWVLNNTTFQQWQQHQHTQNPHTQLLWIKGDPGKGKTMLLCGIINELQQTFTPQSTLLAYFFCQAADPRINSATAVLRGLLYMLVTQQPSLMSHVLRKYETAGKASFEDANAWVVLSEILEDTLHDLHLRPTYLIIDALDECVTDRPHLLEFIARHSSISPRVKWIVSSRNWPEIEEHLEQQAGHQATLSLELNAESVSAAVDLFIERKVDQLAREKQYKAEIRDAVLQHLRSNAGDTFLWVALVCQDLRKTPKWSVLKKLASVFPPTLDSLYGRMMDQISESDSAEICQHVLASVAILYRPVTISELFALVEQLEDVNDLETRQQIIGYCGSFLTLREDTVYFVHQSAKDFLFAKAFNSEVFVDTIEDVHQNMFSRSLSILDRTLGKDMYSLEAPAYPVEDIETNGPDPLAESRYSCVYWIDHLYDSKPEPSQVADRVGEFLREKYLYWLEGLSLCRGVGRGVVSMTKLWSLAQGMRNQEELIQIVEDARRFIMYHRGAIEGYPLQTYASAILFSPTGSLIRQLFEQEKLDTIKIRPVLSEGWSACLQTLENHGSDVTCVTFSHDSTRLASGSEDRTVKVWDVSSGECLQTFEGHEDYVTSITFSHDSTRLASASEDSTIKLWDTRNSGLCLQTLEGHSDWVNSVAFSHDSKRLASASGDRTIKLWDTGTGTCLKTLRGHSGNIRSVAFSHNSTRLASASFDTTIRIWDVSSGTCLKTLNGHRLTVRSVAFSHDSSQLVSGSEDHTIKVWNTSSGTCMQTLKGHNDWANSVAFSHDSTRIISASGDGTVKVWDPNGTCLQTFEGHISTVKSIAISHDSKWLASASGDKTVKVWDANNTGLQKLEGHSGTVRSVAFSPDEMWLASASSDSTIKIWDTNSGACLQTLEGHGSTVTSVAFSHDPKPRLASSSSDLTIKLWDVSSGTCLETVTVDNPVFELSFDVTGARLVTETGTINIQTLEMSLPSTMDFPGPTRRSTDLGTGFSSDGIWIQHDGKNMLWVPSEYRPSRSAVCGTMVGVGVGSGRVWICSMDL